MSNRHENTFWKVAGPVAFALVLSCMGAVGLLLDRRMSRIEEDVQTLLRMHLHTAAALEYPVEAMP